jgi:hypothetical protein
MPGLSSSHLYRKAILALWKFARQKGVKKNGIISFPDAKSVLNYALHLGKDDFFEVSKELENEGVFEVVPGHGIRLINEEVHFL